MASKCANTWLATLRIVSCVTWVVGVASVCICVSLCVSICAICELRHWVYMCIASVSLCVHVCVCV